MTCMPFPLSLLCRLSDRGGRHADQRGIACRSHGLALRVYLRAAPGWLVRWSSRKWMA